MTIYGEPGRATSRPAGGRAPLLRRVVASLTRHLRRDATSDPDRITREAAFERHVEQALSVARAVPTLRVVPADMGRAARS